MSTAGSRRVLWWSLGALAALVLCVWLAPGVCTLLLSAFIVAYICAPAMDLVSKIMPRAVAAAVVLVTLTVLLAGALLLLVPVLGSQWQRVSNRLPQAVDYAPNTVLPWVESRFHVVIPHSGEDFATQLREHMATIGSKIAAPAGELLIKTFGGVIGIVGAIANLILIPVLAFYLMRDYHAMWPRLEALIPRRYKGRVGVLRVEIDSVLGGFVRGQLTVAIILGVLHAVGLVIVGIDGAVVIGLISGFLNMVPYVGTAIGISLALIMAALSFSGWAPILGVLIVFGVSNALESLVITPRIVGDKTGLSPIAVMVAILAGGQVFGFAGLLFAVPTAAVLKVLLQIAKDTYLASEAFGGPTPASVATPGGIPPPVPSEPPAAEGKRRDLRERARERKAPKRPPPAADA